MCGRRGRSYSYRASRQFGLWRCEIRTTPREQPGESTNRPLIGRCRVNVPLRGRGWEKRREKVERTPRINRGHWGPGGSQAIARARVLLLRLASGVGAIRKYPAEDAHFCCDTFFHRTTALSRLLAELRNDSAEISRPNFVEGSRFARSMRERSSRSRVRSVYRR